MLSNKTAEKLNKIQKKYSIRTKNSSYSYKSFNDLGAAIRMLSFLETQPNFQEKGFYLYDNFVKVPIK